MSPPFIARTAEECMGPHPMKSTCSLGSSQHTRVKDRLPQKYQPPNPPHRRTKATQTHSGENCAMCLNPILRQGTGRLLVWTYPMVEQGNRNGTEKQDYPLQNCGHQLQCDQPASLPVLACFQCAGLQLELLFHTAALPNVNAQKETKTPFPPQGENLKHLMSTSCHVSEKVMKAH